MQKGKKNSIIHITIIIVKKKERNAGMFKSIFSKYLTSFIVLLGFGFLAIAIIMSYVVTSYSRNSKNDAMYRTARVIYGTVATDMKKSGDTFSDAVSKNKNAYVRIFDSLSDYSESEIIICDDTGNIIFKGGENNLVKRTKISDDAFEKIVSLPDNYGYSDMDGLFEKRRFNYIYTVESKTEGGENSLMGLIILTSPGSGLDDVYIQIIRVVIVASLWIFAAAVVIVYFISSRITTPIKEISNAVDLYTKGEFDVRIPVTGNDEISTLAVAFNNMADELDKLEKNRNTFISSISHDLRTPMTSIQGFIEGIMDGAIPAEKTDYYLGVVLTEVKRLSRLVNSLLDVSRLESGGFKLNPSYFDVCETARLILISFEEQIDEKKINIEFDSDLDPSFVYADKDAIYQVIYNIVGNAVKFVPEEGTIRLEIKKDADENEYEVSVYNNGSGISSVDLPNVFDRFYKADPSRNLDKTGTGLGLYIAKTKIEAHGEKIFVESVYGEYCKFYFTLAGDEKTMLRHKNGK